MREVLLMLSTCILALYGFALLALSQERHLELVLGPNSPPAHNLRSQRATGFIAIGLNLPTCIATQGAGFGSLLWVMLTCAAAMVIAFLLTWRPHWLRPLAQAVQIVFSVLPIQCSRGKASSKPC